LSKSSNEIHGFIHLSEGGGFVYLSDMDSAQQAIYNEHAEIYKALAHPTRLFIVYEVAENKRSVSELAEMAGIDISTMSKHLEILRSRKVISRVKEGSHAFYKLEFNCLLNFFNCVNNNLSK
jgi:predicted transcriptional regulator